MLTTVDVSGCGRFVLCTAGAGSIIYRLGNESSYYSDNFVIDSKNESVRLYEIGYIETDFKENEKGCQNLAKFLCIEEDSCLFIAGGEDCVIKIMRLDFNGTSFCENKLFGHLKEIKDISLTNDGRLFTAALDNCCREWSWEDQTSSYTCSSILPSNIKQQLSYRKILFLEPNLITLKITQGGRGSSFLIRWKYRKDIEQLFPFESVKVAKRLATCLCLDKTKKYILVGTAEGNIVIVDRKTFSVLKVITKVHGLPITSISSFPTRPLVVTTSMDKTVCFTSSEVSFLSKLSCGWLFKSFWLLFVFICFYVGFKYNFAALPTIVVSPLGNEAYDEGFVEESLNITHSEVTPKTQPILFEDVNEECVLEDKPENKFVGSEVEAEDYSIDGIQDHIEEECKTIECDSELSFEQNDQENIEPEIHASDEQKISEEEEDYYDYYALETEPEKIETDLESEEKKALSARADVELNSTVFEKEETVENDIISEVEAVQKQTEEKVLEVGKIKLSETENKANVLEAVDSNKNLNTELVSESTEKQPKIPVSEKTSSKGSLKDRMKAQRDKFKQRRKGKV